MSSDRASIPPCPTCKRAVSVTASSAPFCSERCRLLDLANWLDGRYAIPGEASEVDERVALTGDYGDYRDDADEGEGPLH